MDNSDIQDHMGHASCFPLPVDTIQDQFPCLEFQPICIYQSVVVSLIYRMPPTTNKYENAAIHVSEIQ